MLRQLDPPIATIDLRTRSQRGRTLREPFDDWMIYLDHAATTPLDPRVLEAMLPFLSESYGNPSSVHSIGRKARVAVEDARATVASLLGAEPSEIIFTSSGTEADALAVAGVLHTDGVLLTSAAEHEAILKPAKHLRESGRALILQPGTLGAVTEEQVSEALIGAPDVRLASFMYANNEVGTVTDLQAIARQCARHGVPLHTDAVQAMGLVDIDLTKLPVDLLSFSGHKINGPKGIGALFVRGGVELRPHVLGSQERGRRGGTENVAGIVGLARALEIAVEERQVRFDHARTLRRRLLEGLDTLIDLGGILASPEEESAALPHIINIAFRPIDGRPLDGEMLILNMDMEGVGVSAGSACTSGALEPSHVILAMGHDRHTASAALRISTGLQNSLEEIDRMLDVATGVVRRMRRLAAA
jgi:cysteine desulfurase